VLSDSETHTRKTIRDQNISGIAIEQAIVENTMYWVRENQRLELSIPICTSAGAKKYLNEKKAKRSNNARLVFFAKSLLEGTRLFIYSGKRGR